MAKVSLQHVSSRGTFAAKDFSADIADREFVVFAGPPGCGVSAALRMIAGLDPIAQGDIAIADKRINDLPPKDRDIAMVFRHDALYPRMTVSENMVFGLKLRKFPQPEIKRRLAEAAAILELEPLLDRKPAALSPAERFRANLARAVARQPKVFLFEEPLATLDPALRPRMRAEILRLHHRLQATMIYASHDPLDAMTMGQRAVIMRDGVIQQTGAPLALYREPDNLFVAGYLGAPPMNFIHGKLREAGETLVFKESGEGILEFKFPATTAAKPFAGREVIAGVRPESIPIITSPVPAKAAAPVYKALLDIVEPMGAETQAHIETGAHRIIARTPAAVPAEEAGHRVQFEIDPAAVHLFDPESTKRITD